MRIVLHLFHLQMSSRHRGHLREIQKDDGTVNILGHILRTTEEGTSAALRSGFGCEGLLTQFNFVHVAFFSRKVLVIRKDVLH